MRKTSILAATLALALAAPGFAQSRPANGYPDRFQINVPIEEIYKNNDDWTYYFADLDWNDFLIYMNVLAKKGYEFEGGTPDYISNYVNYLEIDKSKVDFPVNLVAGIKGWAKIRLQFNPDGAKSPSGKPYTMSIRVRPGPDMLMGRHGPSLNPEQYMIYLQQAPKQNQAKYKPR